MDYNEFLKWKDFGSQSEAAEFFEGSNKALSESLSESLNQIESGVRIAKFFAGMVNEYQQNIIPLYKKSQKMWSMSATQLFTICLFLWLADAAQYVRKKIVRIERKQPCAHRSSGQG